MLSYRVTIHARLDEVATGPEVQLAGGSFRTLAVAPAALAATTFDCTFEEASTRLEALERMFLEPDGSFVWTSSQSDQVRQVDGNLYDRAERLAFVDLERLLSGGGIRAAAVARLAGRRRSSCFSSRAKRWCWTKRSFAASQPHERGKSGDRCNRYSTGARPIEK